MEGVVAINDPDWPNALIVAERQLEKIINHLNSSKKSSVQDSYKYIKKNCLAVINLEDEEIKVQVLPLSDLFVNEDDCVKAYSCCFKCSIGFIDYSKHQDDGFKYVFVFQDKATKFTVLKSLKEKEEDEIHECLLEIFSFIGVPAKIYTHEKTLVKTSMGKEVGNFCQNFSTEIKQPKDRNFEDEECLRIDNLIRNWMKSKQSDKWSNGLYFVQFQNNCSYNNLIQAVPFNVLFKPRYTYSKKKYTRYLIKKLDTDTSTEPPVGNFSNSLETLDGECNESEKGRQIELQKNKSVKGLSKETSESSKEQLVENEDKKEAEFIELECQEKIVLECECQMSKESEAIECECQERIILECDYKEKKQSAVAEDEYEEVSLRKNVVKCLCQEKSVSSEKRLVESKEIIVPELIECECEERQTSEHIKNDSNEVKVSELVECECEERILKKLMLECDCEQEKVSEIVENESEVASLENKLQESVPQEKLLSSEKEMEIYQPVKEPQSIEIKCQGRIMKKLLLECECKKKIPENVSENKIVSKLKETGSDKKEIRFLENQSEDEKGIKILKENNDLEEDYKESVENKYESSLLRKKSLKCKLLVKGGWLECEGEVMDRYEFSETEENDSKEEEVFITLKETPKNKLVRKYSLMDKKIIVEGSKKFVKKNKLNECSKDKSEERTYKILKQKRKYVCKKFIVDKRAKKKMVKKVLKDSHKDETQGDHKEKTMIKKLPEAKSEKLLVIEPEDNIVSNELTKNQQKTRVKFEDLPEKKTNDETVRAKLLENNATDKTISKTKQEDKTKDTTMTKKSLEDEPEDTEISKKKLLEDKPKETTMSKTLLKDKPTDATSSKKPLEDKPEDAEMSKKKLLEDKPKDTTSSKKPLEDKPEDSEMSKKKLLEDKPEDTEMSKKSLEDKPTDTISKQLLEDKTKDTTMTKKSLEDEPEDTEISKKKLLEDKPKETTMSKTLLKDKPTDTSSKKPLEDEPEDTEMSKKKLLEDKPKEMTMSKTLLKDKPTDATSSKKPLEDKPEDTEMSKKKLLEDKPKDTKISKKPLEDKPEDTEISKKKLLEDKPEETIMSKDNFQGKPKGKKVIIELLNDEHKNETVSDSTKFAEVKETRQIPTKQVLLENKSIIVGKPEKKGKIEKEESIELAKDLKNLEEAPALKQSPIHLEMIPTRYKKSKVYLKVYPADKNDVDWYVCSKKDVATPRQGDRSGKSPVRHGEQVCLVCRKKRVRKPRPKPHDKNIYAVGTTVRLRVPVMERLTGYPNYILASIVERTGKGQYRLATPYGFLKEWFHEDQLNPCHFRVFGPEERPKQQIVGIREALAWQVHGPVGKDLVRCTCPRDVGFCNPRFSYHDRCQRRTAWR